MAIDHDQIFKRLIEAFFREFLELFCPAEERLIDFSRVEFLREEHFTTSNGGSADAWTWWPVGLKAGGEKFVLVHGEFEASRKEPDFPRRMFQYFCQLFLRYDTEIVPIAVFTDDARLENARAGLFRTEPGRQEFMRFEYHLVKLKNLDYRQFLESNNPLAYGLMAKMEYNRKDRVRLKADFLRWILACPIDPARQSLLVEFVETYVALADHEQAEFQQFVRNDPEYTQVQQMITTYEQKGSGRSEEGREAGREAGRSDSGVGEEVWQAWRCPETAGSSGHIDAGIGIVAVGGTRCRQPGRSAAVRTIEGSGHIASIFNHE